MYIVLMMLLKWLLLLLSTCCVVRYWKYLSFTVIIALSSYSSPPSPLPPTSFSSTDVALWTLCAWSSLKAVMAVTFPVFLLCLFLFPAWSHSFLRVPSVPQVAFLVSHTKTHKNTQFHTVSLSLRVCLSHSATHICFVFRSHSSNSSCDSPSFPEERTRWGPAISDPNSSLYVDLLSVMSRDTVQGEREGGWDGVWWSGMGCGRGKWNRE